MKRVSNQYVSAHGTSPGPFASRPYCNTTLPIADRVANFISYLSYVHTQPPTTGASRHMQSV